MHNQGDSLFRLAAWQALWTASERVPLASSFARTTLCSARREQETIGRDLVANFAASFVQCAQRFK